MKTGKNIVLLLVVLLAVGVSGCARASAAPELTEAVYTALPEDVPTSTPAPTETPAAPPDVVGQEASQAPERDEQEPSAPAALASTKAPASTVGPASAPVTTAKPAATSAPATTAKPAATSTATATPAPTATPHTHTWITEEVPGSGHYESRFAGYADGEPIYDIESVWVGSASVCNVCGAEYTYAGGISEHQVETGHNGYHARDIYETNEVIVGYEQVAVYEDVWVIDTPDSSRTYCSDCGAEK